MSTASKSSPLAVTLNVIGEKKPSGSVIDLPASDSRSIPMLENVVNSAGAEHRRAPRELESRLVPSFFSRAVTGPLRNRSLCYVCRHGDRPVVMVVMRKLGPELRPLLRNIDRLVDRHRADGLRSFGVVLSDDPFRTVSPVQTFSFNYRVTMPLTVATEVVAEPTSLDISSKTALTIILYRKRKVEARFDYPTDSFRFEDARMVIERVKHFIGEPVSR